MVANKKAPCLTIVDPIPWFDAHWSQFFTEFDWFAVLTSHLDACISRYGDFCANDDNDNNNNLNDNDDTTDCFTPCACTQDKNKMPPPAPIFWKKVDENQVYNLFYTA